MFDLHAHLLPGIDDGAPDLATSLAMARLAVEDGITHLVCTPHIHLGRYENTATTIAEATIQWRQALRTAGIELQVGYAAEVRIGPEIMNLLEQDAIPFLGLWEGRRVLLLEFPPAGIPVGSDRLTRWLLGQGIQPLLAHPERNKECMRHPNHLRPFLRQGCLLQITAGSLTGRFGAAAQTLAESLLTAGQVSLLATDAHNLVHRAPRLREGMDAAARLIGENEAERLVRDVPQQITAGQFAGEPL